MIDVIRQNRSQIQALCQAHGVRRLELIGSAARGTFDPAHSDLDFLVEFEDGALRDLSPHYFGVLFGLEDLLKRKVDLIRVSSDSDPRFLAVAKRHVDVIYDAGSTQAA
jgi:uncharacterized protein